MGNKKLSTNTTQKRKMIPLWSLMILPLITGMSINNPPAPWHAAQMARYIIHKADWVSIATISVQSNITGYPFVSLKSLSDGPANNGTGIPYLYMTDQDVSGTDILYDNRVSIMASLAQSDFCQQKQWDPQDPRCAKTILTGRLKKVKRDDPEYTFGLLSLYERHPQMKSWPKDHEFYVAKLDIELIEVLDFFGGIKKVNVDDYYNATLKSEDDNSVNFSVDVVEVFVF